MHTRNQCKFTGGCPECTEQEGVYYKITDESDDYITLLEIKNWREQLKTDITLSLSCFCFGSILAYIFYKLTH